MQGLIEDSFATNLEAMAGYDADNVVKVIIPKSMRREVQKALLNMNITRASLFPGIDGYARSLGSHIPIIEPTEWPQRY